VTAVCIAGAAQAAFASSDFASLWDGIWWAVTTTTTVGYGDIYPTTVQGRIIGMILMFVGIGFLSLLTASIASRFVKEERGEEHLDVLEVLRRLEADVAELKARIPAP
jgi:voltage-gated potassium channel